LVGLKRSGTYRGSLRWVPGLSTSEARQLLQYSPTSLPFLYNSCTQFLRCVCACVLRVRAVSVIFVYVDVVSYVEVRSMKVRRVKIIVLDVDGEIASIRTVLAPRAKAIAEEFVKLNEGSTLMVDHDGDYLIQRHYT